MIRFEHVPTMVVAKSGWKIALVVMIGKGLLMINRFWALIFRAFKHAARVFGDHLFEEFPTSST